MSIASKPEGPPRVSRSPDVFRGNCLSERVREQLTLFQSLVRVWRVVLPLLLHHFQPLVKALLPFIDVLSPFRKIHSTSGDWCCCSGWPTRPSKSGSNQGILDSEDEYCMIEDNQWAMPVHRELQLGKFILRNKYSVKCRRLWSLTRFSRGCRFAPLKYLYEVRLVDPVSHGPILSHSCTPFRVSPSAFRRCRVEIAQDCYPVAFLPRL